MLRLAMALALLVGSSLWTVQTSRAQIAPDANFTPPIYTPDTDPETYFANRSRMRQSMNQMAEEIGDSGLAGFDVVSVIIDKLVGETGFTNWPFTSFARQRLYIAAMETGDCRLARHMLWDALIEDFPFVAIYRHEDFFERVIRDRLYAPHFPALAACLHAREARTLAAMIVNDSLESTGTRDLIRPFVNNRSWYSASGTLHGSRDFNFWRLIEMASNSHLQTYAPSAVLLVELAIELESLNLPDDILHMLLLRAQATWSDLDP